jgi:hypothetical protein
MSSMSGNSGYGGPAGAQQVSGLGRTGNKVPKGYKEGQLQQFTPDQMQLFNQMFSSVSPDSQTSRLAAGDQSTFEQMEAPAMRQFQELQGQTASRFSNAGGQGSLGARHGSGFQNEINSQTSNFAQDLAARRGDLMRQAIKDLHGMSSDLLGQRPYENFLVEKQKKQNPWADIAGKFAGAIPGATSSFLGV